MTRWCSNWRPQHSGFALARPSSADTVAGPVISGAQRERIEALVDSARGEGFHHRGGRNAPRRQIAASSSHPLLIADATNQMRVPREVIFAWWLGHPVLHAGGSGGHRERFGFRSLQLHLQLGTPPALTQVAGQLQAGTIQINTTSMKLDLPRCGAKMSGIGREGGAGGSRGHDRTALCRVVLGKG